MATSPAYSRFTARLPGAASVIAFVTLVLVVIRAVRTVDPYWDTLAYHWPFAARVVGLCGPDCYAWTPAMERRYEGFPLLLHALQGALWRLTGTPGMADLINVGAILGLCFYLKRRFVVPVSWSWLAFLAIPLVQVHLTGTYVDVPLNAAVTIALMVALRMLVFPGADQRLDVGIALASLVFAAASKFQMVPIALLTWLGIVVLAARTPSSVGFNSRVAAFTVLAVGGYVLMTSKLILNAIAFGNPFYPIAAAVGPLHWTAPEGMQAANSISDQWLDSPAPLRWLASVLEYDAFRGRPIPWTIDQGDVQQSSQSFRMGGYFVPYVLGAVALLWWSARLSVAARWPVALVLVLSLICASAPAAHELRYYLFWMLSLLSIVLVVAHSPAFASAQQPLQRSITYSLISIALASVIAMTGAAYLKTKGLRLRDLVHPTDAIVAQVPEGGTLCIVNGRNDAFLYASVFHPRRQYLTRVLDSDGDRDCTVRFDPDRGISTEAR